MRAERGLHIATVEEFAAVEEPGAAALLGTDDDALIGEGTDTMVYGDGGAGKTTLTLDLGFHFAAGAPTWLGIRVARAVRVLVIENEGPRPLLRAKFRRKLEAWEAKARAKERPSLAGRIKIVEAPWGEFTFGDEGWCDTLAATVTGDEVDVLIAGPVTRLGMDEAGTLQQVNDFMALVRAVREKSGRRLVVILVHHENRAGAVSGAWEAAGDTLLHVEERGKGHTHLHVQKARWSSEHHGAKMDLAWTDGEGYEVEAQEERDYAAEMEALLADGEWRTAGEIANKRDHHEKPGIGAGKDTVKETLAGRPDLFVERKGDELTPKRSAKGTFYQLASPRKPVEPVRSLGTGGQLAHSHTTPVGGGGGASPVPPPASGSGPVAVATLIADNGADPGGSDDYAARYKRDQAEGRWGR
jgi:hypothetical protein